MFPKVPPIDKVKLKLGDRAADPVLSSIMRFLEARNRDGAIEAPLPSLDAWPTHLSESLSNAPVEELFPIIDLYRAALVDARVSGCFFEEQGLYVLSMKVSSNLIITASQ